MGSSAQVRLPQPHPNTIRFGTAGWSYKDWEGVFYPSGMQHRKLHPLEYLARFFDTTEINTSFYGPIKPQLAKLWCTQGRGREPQFSFHGQAVSRLHALTRCGRWSPTSAATIRPTDDDEARDP